ncbi:uncharacterized protein LOC141850169 isoform X1 [Brevipalpus obovatus]|uniref:uncharacterized protein LOC141850169 isoform X1 n=1 Tax=Brevipalpus obovatus TaxID=246614 RepID=UPI003D9F5167
MKWRGDKRKVDSNRESTNFRRVRRLGKELKRTWKLPRWSFLGQSRRTSNLPRNLPESECDAMKSIGRNEKSLRSLIHRLSQLAGGFLFRFFNNTLTFIKGCDKVSEFPTFVGRGNDSGDETDFIDGLSLNDLKKI